MSSKIAGALFCLVFALACSKKPQTLADYYAYVNDHGNGLVKTKSTEDIRFTVKYLPHQLLALQNGDSIPSAKKSALSNANSLTFIMDLSPADKGESTDLLYTGVRDYKQYKERILDLNFSLQPMIWLELPGRRVHPALCFLENTYGLSTGKKVWITFSLEELGQSKEGKDLDLVFHDQVFSTGMNHFVFTKESIAEVSGLNL
jgi:hypothetical protein